MDHTDENTRRTRRLRWNNEVFWEEEKRAGKRGTMMTEDLARVVAVLLVDLLGEWVERCSPFQFAHIDFLFVLVVYFLFE